MHHDTIFWTNGEHGGENMRRGIVFDTFSHRLEANVTKIPAALILIRAICGPALVAAAGAEASAWLLAGLVTFAFVSDVFDGIIARRLGVATEMLRRADTIVDTAFYVCAALALLLRSPSVFNAHLVGLGLIASLELARCVIERQRYGRLASYPMWSDKVWGITLWLGFCEAFLTGQAGPFMQLAVVMGVVADCEGLTASLVLSSWQHDICTIWHAVRLESSGQSVPG